MESPNRVPILCSLPVPMSLVAKYSRRYDDEEDEPSESVAPSKSEETVVSKKREAEEKLPAPPAKKAKVFDAESEKLELPEVFKEKRSSASQYAAMEVDTSGDKGSKTAALVPRQVRYAQLGSFASSSHNMQTLFLISLTLCFFPFQRLEAEHCDGRGVGGEVAEGSRRRQTVNVSLSLVRVLTQVFYVYSNVQGFKEFELHVYAGF